MKILITGDFVISQPYKADNISQEIIDIFQSSDYNIVNLEAPVTTSSKKIVKTGPHLKANKESTLSVLKALNINAVTLANNHLLDYDQQGVLDTIQFCQENSIVTVGGGKNKEDAATILYLDSPEGKISIINIAENEWASATQTTAGANGMDLIDNMKQIKEAKSKSDFLLVIVHGGHEYYNLPSPRMQKQYRFYIDNGADAVIGHHPHCISGMEIYNTKPIYYSLGNFLFTRFSTYDDWYEGMVLQIEIKNGMIISSPFYVQQDKNSFRLSFPLVEKKKKMKDQFIDYSNIIVNSAKLEESWNGFVEERTKIFSSYWSPLSFVNNIYFKALFNKVGIFKPNRKASALFFNLIRCEAHQDLSKSFLKKEVYKSGIN